MNAKIQISPSCLSVGVRAGDVPQVRVQGGAGPGGVGVQVPQPRLPQGDVPPVRGGQAPGAEVRRGE
jgi:hypothetical protein